MEVVGPRVVWLRYVDDILVVVPRRTDLPALLTRLNAVHPSIQFTVEEEQNERLPFLDTVVTRQDSGPVFCVYRKPTNTKVGLKPQSCQNPRTIIATFKGELCRCYRLCTSIEQTKKEIQFTLDLYEDNGHDRAKLKKIADAYVPPTAKNRTKPNNKERRPKQTEPPETEVRNLFRALPYRTEEDLQEEEEEESIEIRPYACIQYIPEISSLNIPTGPGVRKESPVSPEDKTT